MAIARTEDWVPAETFGTRLAMIRHSLKLNQKRAAQLCGIPEDSWSNWERGVSEPRRMADVVRKIHRATNVDMAWLMWGTPSPGARVISELRVPISLPNPTWGRTYLRAVGE